MSILLHLRVQRQTEGKLVILLRNPVHRAISHFSFLKQLPFTLKMQYGGVKYRDLTLREYLNNYEMMMHTPQVWRDGYHLIYWLTGYVAASGKNKFSREGIYGVRHRANVFYNKKNKWRPSPNDERQRTQGLAATKEFDASMLNMTHLFTLAIERLE